MTRTRGAAPRIAAALAVVLGTNRIPFRVRAWDGSVAGPDNAPELVFHSRRALRRMVWSPGQLGLCRAYVAGDIDAPGDLFESFAALSSVGRFAETGPFRPLRVRERWTLLTSAALLGALGLQPRPPPEEADVVRTGKRHSRGRDAAAISHHYDVGNSFYSLVLGPSMVYSCAVWENGQENLEAAQDRKLDLVCRKLGLRPGMRVLDVGCGWGSFAVHAARHYGVAVVGVTLSGEQAVFARERVAAAGLADRVEIRVQDYRDVNDGPFDAVSSIGMSEHVGRAEIGRYATRLQDLLRPGARLLNHAISWNAGETLPDPDSFIPRYVFPDGEMLGLAEVVGVLESAGLEVIDVEALRQHYALTLRAWVRNLEEHWDEAVRIVGAGRARVWRLYLVVSAVGFETGLTGVNQVLVQRPGGIEPPLRRAEWI
ncbi:cyclopropane-fatty-acyl-phospholipid synthase family protein [Arthrobacter sp. Br18]|uniref:SAM-dependent methyltransferase n=1 Tax=Arthrobacter sp. Br18 TaxID=1312954 RepID=UPI00047BAB52|nr:cyclopropane-fatty-acyl-phospholipid synthase family protein [Arthrobacter sp. Br18]